MMYDFLNPEKRVIHAAAFGAALIIWIFSAKALAGRIVELSDELHYQKSELAYQNGILAKQDEFLKRYEEVKSDFSSSTENSEDRLSAFITEVELWSKDEKLVLQDVRPLGVETENGKVLRKVSLELEGDMLPLSRFLYRVVSSKDPIEIQRISLYQKIRSRSSINLELELAFIDLESK